MLWYEDSRFEWFLTGCRAATTDHAKHALSMDCTLITAFFILISRGNVTTRMQQICLHWESNSGIRPHFWNSSSDARLDNARCVSFLQIRRIEEFIISCDDTFIRTFITCYEFTIEYSVWFYRVMSLYNVSHTFSSTISLASSRNWRSSISRVYDGTSQYMAFERRIYLAPQGPALYPALYSLAWSRTESLIFSSHAIWAINGSQSIIPNV